jgi:hypothetical protein
MLGLCFYHGRIEWSLYTLTVYFSTASPASWAC